MIKNTLLVLASMLFVSITSLFAGQPSEIQEAAPFGVVDRYTFTPTVTFNSVGSSGSWLSVPQWGSDPSHAGKILGGVTVNMQVTRNQNITWEYFGSLTTGTAILGHIEDADLRVSNGPGTLNLTYVYFNEQTDLPITGPYDGTFDYGGTSGGAYVVPGVTLIDQGNYRVTDPEAIPFIGTGNASVYYHVHNPTHQAISVPPVVITDQPGVYQFLITVDYHWY